MPEISWNRVAVYCRDELGASDFHALLNGIPNRECDAAWDDLVGQFKASLKRKLENASENQTRLYVGSQLRQWRADQSQPVTLAVACKIRLALASRPTLLPAPGRQEPPFQPGNTLAVTHGARSEQMIAARLPAAVERIDSLLAQEVPGGAHVSDVILRQRAARTLVQLEMLDALLDQRGIIDGSDMPRPASMQQTRLENLLLRQFSELGLGPAARARLQVDKAIVVREGLAWQLAEERARRRRRTVNVAD